MTLAEDGVELRAGFLRSAHVDALIATLPRGGALLMRPLLLHASSRALQPAHRRVVHVEFSPDELPAGLAWFETPAPAFSS